MWHAPATQLHAARGDLHRVRGEVDVAVVGQAPGDPTNPPVPKSDANSGGRHSRRYCTVGGETVGDTVLGEVVGDTVGDTVVGETVGDTVLGEVVGDSQTHAASRALSMCGKAVG